MPMLTANQTGANYQWVDCDNGNSPIAGATNQSYAAIANGNYAVEITVGSCTATSACENVSTVGIKDIQANSLKVYPNPTYGQLTINTTDKVLNVEMFDIQGRHLKLFTGNTKTIDIDEVENGVYFLRVTTDKTINTIKVLKK